VIIELQIDRSEARLIQNRVDHAEKDVRKIFNTECEKLLKKKGIDNAIPPYELVLGMSGAILIYLEE